MYIRKWIYYIGIVLIILGVVGIYMFNIFASVIAIIGIIFVLFSDQKLWVKIFTIIILPIRSILGFLISIFAFSEPL